jgi:hypothetical protein
LPSQTAQVSLLRIVTLATDDAANAMRHSAVHRALRTAPTFSQSPARNLCDFPAQLLKSRPTTPHQRRHTSATSACCTITPARWRCYTACETARPPRWL